MFVLMEPACCLHVTAHAVNPSPRSAGFRIARRTQGRKAIRPCASQAVQQPSLEMVELGKSGAKAGIKPHRGACSRCCSPHPVRWRHVLTAIYLPQGCRSRRSAWGHGAGGTAVDTGAEGRLAHAMPCASP